MGMLGELGIPVHIRELPNEVPDPIPFSQDQFHASYDARYADRYWRVLLQADRVLKAFRARFTGKCSPVHFFWGSNDLAVTRFSGRPAPVAFPDSMRVLDATVTRRTRSGDVLGPTHRVDVVTALKAMTIWPAWQHFEEDDKGSIEVGKLADFVILSDDPTAVDPETLDQLRVLVTIKEGAVVYEAAHGKASQGSGSDFPAGAKLAPGFELLEALEDAGPAPAVK